MADVALSAAADIAPSPPEPTGDQIGGLCCVVCSEDSCQDDIAECMHMPGIIYLPPPQPNPKNLKGRAARSCQSAFEMAPWTVYSKNSDATASQPKSKQPQQRPNRVTRRPPKPRKTPTASRSSAAVSPEPEGATAPAAATRAPAVRVGSPPPEAPAPAATIAPAATPAEPAAPPRPKSPPPPELAAAVAELMEEKMQKASMPVQQALPNRRKVRRRARQLEEPEEETPRAPGVLQQLPLPMPEQSFQHFDEEWASLMTPSSLGLGTPSSLGLGTPSAPGSGTFSHLELGMPFAFESATANPFEFPGEFQQQSQFQNQQQQQHQHQPRSMEYAGCEAGGFGVVPSLEPVLDDFLLQFLPADPPLDGRQGWCDFLAVPGEDKDVTTGVSDGNAAAAAAAPPMALADSFGGGFGGGFGGDCFSSTAYGWREPGFSCGGVGMGLGTGMGMGMEMGVAAGFPYGGDGAGVGIAAGDGVRAGNSSSGGGGGCVAETL